MPHAGGRPKYAPTDADRATVRNMSAAGIPHETIASCLGKNGIDDKTMRKHFRRELDISQYLVTGFAMSRLYAAIQAGEAWAVCFWMKCRAGFQETSAHRLVDSVGKDTSPVVLQAVSIATALRQVRLEIQEKRALEAAKAQIPQESRAGEDAREER
jgi:hypothetical protein